MRLFGRVLSAATFLGVFATAQPAMAEFSVCNESPKLAFVSVGYWDNTNYVTEGWWTIDPGSCVITYAGDLQWQYYYVYGETEEDKNGNFEYWGAGEKYLCVNSPNEFKIIGDVNCDTGFFEIDTGKERSFTFTLE